MKSSQLRNIDPTILRKKPVVAAILLALATPFSADVAMANSAFGSKTDIGGNLVDVPTFFASSPSGIQPAYDPAIHGLSPTLKVDTGRALRKFVDPLGGVKNGLEPSGNAVGPNSNDLTSGIPVAITEKWVNPAGVATTDDYYEIAIVEYTEQMHSDLAKPTRLRGYVQIETDNIAKNGLKDAAGVGSEHIPATYPDGSPIYKWVKDPVSGLTVQTNQQVYFVHKPHYLGPAIVASRGTPVRMKVTNYLPYTDTSGLSVGSVNGTGGELFIPVDESIPGGGPVIDKNGMQVMDPVSGKPVKMGQNRASIHWHGGDTPWISDGTPHQWFAPAGDISYNIAVDPVAHPHGMGRGVSAVNVPDMADPGDGAYTLYFPNTLSGRMMFYHDHTSGLTRLNVYAGMAAGYIITDPVEQDLVSRALGVAPGSLDAIGTPLVFQDKGFVPKNIGPNAVAVDANGNATTVPASQDAKWDSLHWGQEGDLFWPHVYETNQDPNSADGTNPVGRWDWGPWFWPVFPAQYSLPSGVYGDVSLTPESFMDTALVNGKVYPTMEVEPKAYRFRLLNAANDRTLSLNLFQAVDANGVICDAIKNPLPAVATAVPGGLAPATCTELKMVPALPTPGFPANWPTDGRVGGVPDPATAGPDIIQIGSEGGLLPAPAIMRAQPITYETNAQSITIFNVLNHGVLLGGAERADVLIDFSKFAGKTLIVYNDAPAPMPGFDPRIDYYTGMGDYTGAGGAFDPQPGYGPNTRTFMQIKVGTTVTPGSGGPLNLAALQTLPTAYAQSQPAPNIPQAVYNTPFGTKSTATNYASIGTGSRATNGLYSYTDEAGVVQTLPVINKAIQELFDPIFGRMNATLAVELPMSSATIATTIPLNYIDAPVEAIDAIKEGETQIWKITHNGVDDHPVHFHLVNVQVLNRVGWDGKIKAPDANEVGWKETVRMNPLEDVYVAVKASKPVAPFGVPTSNRLLDPAQLQGGTLGFTPINPLTGQAPATPYTNVQTSFDNEYVWHCHILGHEENDFMRPFIFHPTNAVPDAPTNVTVTGSTVTWTDPTPPGGVDSFNVPTNSTNVPTPTSTTVYLEPTSNPKNEIGFQVAVHDKAVPPQAVLVMVPANTTSWTDSTGLLDLTGATVTAYNAAGASVAGVANGTAYVAPVAGNLAAGTGPAVTGATGPTNLAIAPSGTNSATLTWTGVAGASGYTVNGTAVAATCTANAAGGTTCTYVANGLAAGVNNFAVSADTLNGATAVASTSMFNGVAYAPLNFTQMPLAALKAAMAPVAVPAGTIALNWANDVRNVNNVTGFLLTWTRLGRTTGAGQYTFGPNTTGATITGLQADQDYAFKLQAISANGSSAVVSSPAGVGFLSSP